MGSDAHVVVYSRWSLLRMGGSLKAGTTVYKIKYKFYEKYSLPKIQCKNKKNYQYLFWLPVMRRHHETKSE